MVVQLLLGRYGISGDLFLEHHVTEAQLQQFIQSCRDKYMKAKIEPGKIAKYSVLIILFDMERLKLVIIFLLLLIVVF